MVTKKIKRIFQNNNTSIDVIYGNKYININWFNCDIIPRVNITIVPKSNRNRYLTKAIVLTISIFTFSIALEYAKYKYN